MESIGGKVTTSSGESSRIPMSSMSVHVVLFFLSISVNDGAQVHWDKPNEFNLRTARRDE